MSERWRSRGAAEPGARGPRGPRGIAHLESATVFACTRCGLSTTDRPTADMRYVWPPPNDWSFMFINPAMVPMKLRKHRFYALICPDCSKKTQVILDEAAQNR